MNMRRFLGVLPLIVAAIPVSALARDCDGVKAEIDAKIKAKGVTNYALEIVNGPDIKEKQIVGNCDGGARKIVYFQTGSPSASKTSATEKARKNKIAELSPSNNQSSQSAVELGSVDQTTSSNQSCAVGNWTGTPRC